jgi:glycosyltransferase involved in cell wall biosynthesis
MISFCCPSRGRPQLAQRLIDTATATQKGDTEFLFYLNDDDEKLQQYKDLLDEKHYTVGPNQSTCYSWNLMADKASHDVVMLMGDDVQVNTPNWDQIIVDEINKFDDKILMVVPSDGRPKNRHLGNEPRLWPDEKLPAAHFAVHKNWTKALGYLAPVFFWHWHVDSYTQKVARKLNRCLYLPTVEFKTKKIIDDNAGKQIRKNFNISQRDEFVWTKVMDRHLQADVNALKTLLRTE